MLLIQTMINYVKTTERKKHVFWMNFHLPHAFRGSFPHLALYHDKKC